VTVADSALEQLAIALGQRFVTAMVTGTGHRPRLSVMCRDTRASGDVLADDRGWFWWPWAERIAATDDPVAATRQVSAALRGTTTPGDGR
jgi:hypothetical protein